MRVAEGNLDDPRVVAILHEHLAGVAAVSPQGSVHALDLTQLRSSDVTFYTVWDGKDVVGCGALKHLISEAHAGEVKSMRTAPSHLRRGVASRLLTHIINEAHQRGYTRLLLETGSGPAFDPAIALYRKFGFVPTGPFADYPADDVFSRFMTLHLHDH